MYFGHRLTLCKTCARQGIRFQARALTPEFSQRNFLELFGPAIRGHQLCSALLHLVHPNLQPDEPKMPKMAAQEISRFGQKQKVQLKMKKLYIGFSKRETDSSGEDGIAGHSCTSWLLQKRTRNWQETLFFSFPLNKIAELMIL